MAGHVMKRRRLMNVGGRRRHMSDKQIKIFGTPRQKAALKARNRRNRGGFRHMMKQFKVGKGSSGKYKYKTASRKRRTQRRGFEGPYRTSSGAIIRARHNQGDILGSAGGLITRAEHAAERAVQRIEHAAEEALHGVTSRLNRGRRKNVGEILTVMPANPGRRRRSSMYRTHNRRRNRRRRHTMAVTNRRYPNRRRRHNRRRYAHNPTVVRYHNRRRRHHYMMHNRRRRRNPGFLTGNIGAIVGVLGGAAVTKIITGFLPATFTTGFTGYLATGVGAVVAGQIAGKVTRNRQFGNWVMVGGLLILALELVSAYVPGLQLPFGLTSGGTSGLGLISSSNFYVPQVNMPGSMASFVTPAGITAAIPVVPTSSGMHGLGAQFTPGLRTMRRIGRMR